ncbi:MAG: glycosyltransferase family 4 protein [Candidatus Coatesbacteria bacterium]
MKIFFLWHAAADPNNHPLFDAMLRARNLEIRVLTLPGVEDRQVRWRLAQPVERRNPATGSRYRIVPGRAVSAASLGHHWYTDLPKHLREFRPDLIHLATGEAAMAVAVEMAAARRVFAPRARLLIHIVQNLLVDYRWPWPLLERWVLRQVDGAVAYSPGAEWLLRRRGFGKRIWVQPFGVDARLFRPRRLPPRRFGLATGVPVIGWVGRIFLGKGLHLLLEASARMKRNHQILVVGDGPRRDAEHARAARLGIAARVRWAGPVSLARIPDCYAAMDVYTHPGVSRPADMPAWKEQFARTLPEAMLTGLPVVGTRSGEIPWVVGDGGIIVPERDPAALARALDRLMGSAALRRQLGGFGRARALEHFTFDAAAAGLVRIWREALANR